MREPSPMPGDKNLGITLSRTLIPTLPPEYLSRRHLFPRIDNERSGTTFVIAPAGYGKTTLVAEWAQNHSKKVIWVTVANGDSNNEMSAMVIAATRRVIPGFAPWFESEYPIRPTELIRRWGNELLQTGRDYVFVLDNLRSQEDEDVEIAAQLIAQFPENLHFVAIRNSEIEEIYSVCASRGPIKVINQNDLRFSDEEIESYALTSDVALNSQSREILAAGAGWPAATSLLLAHLEINGDVGDIEKILGSQSEPLRALVEMVISQTDPEVLDICEKLSVLEIFTDEQAQLVLESSYSYDLLSHIAYKGEIFTHLRDVQGSYSFSPMVRQVLNERLRQRGSLKMDLHKKLITYFESIHAPSEAIVHAFQSGNVEKITELFPDAARIKQAQGKGGELLRWSVFAGQSPEDGELKRLTLVITGLLADLDFAGAAIEIAKLQLLSQSPDISQFYRDFAVAATAYSALSLGNFNEVEEIVKTVKVGTSDCLLGVDDQINLLRVLATKRYIWNQSEGVEEVFLLAQELGKQTKLSTSHTFLTAINAMYLHQRGEYRRAHEMATGALNQYQRNGFVGSHGPLDVMYIIGRCLLEFSRPQEALLLFEKIRNYSYQWKMWHWYFASDNHIIQFHTYNGNHRESLERIKRAREFAATILSDHNLDTFIDISEMNVRRSLKDFDRLEKLISRAPDIRDTQQFRMALDEFKGRKTINDDAKKLPANNPRDLIWKHLTEVSLNIDTENVALPAMQKAMKVGSEVGAKETFLRQRNEMGNLIIKVANEFPTVYNEELASAMAERIKERGKNMSSNHPALTKRELEILRQLSTGRTLTVIAAELHISQNTMKTHLKNLYKKIGADGRHDAVEKAKSSFLI